MMPTSLTDPPTIALLTDMGLADWYVGTMKGVLLNICPDARLVDICHRLTKQSIEEGAFILNASHRYFAEGTVFLCVVDPKVGSTRKPIVARSEKYFFVGPDNGIFSYVANQSEQWETRVLENPEYRLPDPSQTFHGRDIFSPAAAHLAAGAAFESFGPPLDAIHQMPFIDNIHIRENSLSGRITYIDSYGNLLTNVSREMLEENIDPSNFKLQFKKRTIHGITPHFAAVPLNHPLMYWGSSKLLEIAFNQGSAARKWSVQVGEWFELEWT